MSAGLFVLLLVAGIVAVDAIAVGIAIHNGMQYPFIAAAMVNIIIVIATHIVGITWMILHWPQGIEQRGCRKMTAEQQQLVEELAKIEAEHKSGIGTIAWRARQEIEWLIQENLRLQTSPRLHWSRTYMAGRVATPRAMPVRTPAGAS